MRKYGIVALGLGIVLAGLGLRALAADDKDKLPTAAVAVVKEPPKIDGVLDDAMWKDATELKDLKDPDGNACAAKTRVLVARGDKNIYFGVECFESDVKKLVADVKEHNGNVWEDDSIEFFIDPAGLRKNWYHIVINSQNVTLEGTHEAGNDPTTAAMDWKPKYKSATKVGDKSWTVEVAIPIDQFSKTPVAKDTWTFNFLRNRNVGNDPQERCYWSPIQNSAHNPDKFGTLTNMVSWQKK